MSLFLRWTLLNVLYLVALATLAGAHGGEVVGLARWFVLAILAVYAIASAYAGLLSLRGEKAGLPHLLLAADVCQYLGLLGAATGFLVALSGDDLATVQQRVAGASIGLAATAVGVACSVVLLVEAHLIEHD